MWSRELQNFDPYLGDIIDIFTLRKNKNTVYATFPTGETNRDLSKCIKECFFFV